MVISWRSRCGTTGSAVSWEGRDTAQHSGLGIWHCCSCDLSQIYGSDVIPGPETPYAVWCLKKKRKKKISFIFFLFIINFVKSVPGTSLLFFCL